MRITTVGQRVCVQFLRIAARAGWPMHVRGHTRRQDRGLRQGVRVIDMTIDVDRPREARRRQRQNWYARRRSHGITGMGAWLAKLHIV